MKIVCPTCAATYEVPEMVVTARRKMRCARCATDWVPADLLAPEVQAVMPRATGPTQPLAATAERVPPIPVAGEADPEDDMAGVPAGGTSPEAAPQEAITAQANSLEAAPLEGPVQSERPGAGLPPDEPPVADEPERTVPLAALFVSQDETKPANAVAVRADLAVILLPMPSDSPIVTGVLRPVPPPEKGAPLLAWGGSVAVLAVAVALALVFRAPVMKAWPPSTRLYTAIGLTAP